jgi:hypothetical protein
MDRCHGDRRQDQRGNHSQTEEDMGKFGGFHGNDPPLIVEFIVEVWSNRLMTRL